MAFEILSQADLVRQEHILFISKYYQLASTIILLYDCLLTIDLEIERVWQRTLTGPDLLFALNRYFPLLSYVWIVTAYHQTSWSSSTCNAFLHFPLVMNTISDLVISAIVTLRLYAMYFRNRRVLFFLGALATVQFAFGVWAAANVALLEVPVHSGCIITVKEDSYYLFGLLWGWSVLFDSTIFLMTIWRSLQHRYASKGMRTPLFDLLLRDGIIYFAVMFAAKLVNFIVFWIVSRDLITVNWTFNHTVTVIMISRLFLNVRAKGCLMVYSPRSSLYNNAVDSPIPLSALVAANPERESFD